MSRLARTAAAAVAVAVLPVVAAPAPAGADVPRAVQQEQCEVGKTRYIRESSYNLQALGIPQSWRLATGKGVTVAVVDSGVEDGNAHLRGAVLPGKSFVPGDPTGREDPYGHGTAVAGIIAARYLAAKKSALIGAAPGARILPVRVFAYEPEQPGQTVPFPPSTQRIADGIRWAALHGADVINVSMSTDPGDPGVPALRSAVAFAHRKDVVVVASGGNQAQDAPLAQVRYPAGLPGVIGVAASNASGVVDDWSIHGPHNDVSAPGAQVLIAFHANGDCLAGTKNAFTSWATGFVSALAAQLRERYPKASADEIAYRIMASAERPRQGARDDVSGWGEIQPYDALTMTVDPGRPGPPVPGAKASSQVADVSSDVRPLAAAPDPMAPARREVLWWGLAAVGLAVLALVLRPLVARQVRRR